MHETRSHESVWKRRRIQTSRGRKITRERANSSRTPARHPSGLVKSALAAVKDGAWSTHGDELKAPRSYSYGDDSSFECDVALEWGDELTLGHTQLVGDLYAINRGR